MTTLDKLYYIVDTAGNFYRINKNNQLVVTDDKEQAGIFNFVEANRRIGSGKKSHFYLTIPVDDEEINQEIILPDSQIQNTSEESEIMNEDSKREINAETSYDLSQIDWKEYLTNFSYIASTIKDYHEELNQELSDIDQKICDMMHYVELNELSDDESIQAMELIKEFRIRRREIKDEMYKAECVQKSIATNANETKAKTGIKQIDGLQNRKYTPRKLEGLFEEHEKRQLEQVEKTAKKREQAIIPFSNNWSKHEKEFNVEEDGEKGEDMDDTKRETIYDGKQNDWKKFAKKQVEFFENIKQYMCNLEIELDQIDDEIEDTLCLIEDVNYNVAQGYKVFKHLKELRNQRKKNLQELDCLDALTEKFDCGAMLEVYRESLDVIECIMNESEISEAALEKVG